MRIAQKKKKKIHRSGGGDFGGLHVLIRSLF